MISTEKLQAVRIIISHDKCPDGTASALILADALPDARVKFIQYGSDEYKNLPAQPGMLFCDFSPPAERAQEFVDAGAIVLDHHKYAKSVVELFGVNGVFADEKAEPGVCGAVLAYRHVWKPLCDKACDACRCNLPDESCKCPPSRFVERFAALAGVRDTWQRQDARWGEACVQSSVLAFVPNEKWLEQGLRQVAARWLDTHEPLGRLLVEKQNADVVRVCEKGWRFTTARGTRVIVIPSTGLTSDSAELLDEAVDVVVGFGYTYEQGVDRPQLILSTRSHTDFDCGAFCKTHGGGGHTKAAGCSFPVGKDDLNPYTTIEALFRGHDAARPR